MSKFVPAGFLIFGLVFVPSDFEVGRNVSCEESTICPRTGLIYSLCLFHLTASANFLEKPVWVLKMREISGGWDTAGPNLELTVFPSWWRGLAAHFLRTQATLAVSLSLKLESFYPIHMRGEVVYYAQEGLVPMPVVQRVKFCRTFPLLAFWHVVIKPSLILFSRVILMLSSSAH